MQIPVYIINLDRRPDRWMRITNCLDKMNIQYERISAIDANNLPREVNSKYFEFSDSAFSSTALCIGDKACTLSHLSAIEAFLKTDSKYAMILEDDAELASNLPDAVMSCNWIPRDANLINFEVGQEAEYLSGPSIDQVLGKRTLRSVYRFQYGGGQLPM